MVEPQTRFEAGEVLQSIRDLILCKAVKTQEAYWRALDFLAAFLRMKRDSYAFERTLLNFHPLNAQRFITWVRHQRLPDGSRYADASIALRLALLRRIFRHLSDLGVAAGNPFALLHDAIPTRQRVQKRPTKLIPYDAISRILDTPDAGTKKGIRDRAILAVMFGGGLRRSEVINLNMNDIGEAADGVPYLVIKSAKGGTTQHQSLPNWAWVRVLAYMEQRDADDPAAHDPLFAFYYKDGEARGRLSDSSLARLYKRHTRSAGVFGAACHSARATAVTMLKEMGFEDRDCAQFLRHRTTQMVQAYDKRARGPRTNPGRQLVYGRLSTAVLASLPVLVCNALQELADLNLYLAVGAIA